MRQTRQPLRLRLVPGTTTVLAELLGGMGPTEAWRGKVDDGGVLRSCHPDLDSDSSNGPTVLSVCADDLVPDLDWRRVQYCNARRPTRLLSSSLILLLRRLAPPPRPLLRQGSKRCVPAQHATHSVSRLEHRNRSPYMHPVVRRRESGVSGRRPERPQLVKS